jgi:hypothetical protein
MKKFNQFKLKSNSIILILLLIIILLIISYIIRDNKDIPVNYIKIEKQFDPNKVKGQDFEITKFEDKWDDYIKITGTRRYIIAIKILANSDCNTFLDNTIENKESILIESSGHKTACILEYCRTLE